MPASPLRGPDLAPGGPGDLPTRDPVEKTRAVDCQRHTAGEGLPAHRDRKEAGPHTALRLASMGAFAYSHLSELRSLGPKRGKTSASGHFSGNLAATGRSEQVRKPTG